MKQLVKNWLFHSLLGAVTLDDVIVEIPGGKIKIGNKDVTLIELRNLKSEVNAIENTRLWQLMNETVKQKAFERGWLKSKSLDELNTAKTMYATLKLQDSIIELIKKQKG